MEVLAFRVVVGKFVQIAQFDPVHEVPTLAIMGEQPDLAEFVVLGDTFIKADEIEFVDRNGVFSLSVTESVFLLIVEFEGLNEIGGRNSCDLDLDEVFLVFALIWVINVLLKGMELSWARLV